VQQITSLDQPEVVAKGLTQVSGPMKVTGPIIYEVSAGMVPYPLLKMLQVRYRIPSATGTGIQ